VARDVDATDPADVRRRRGRARDAIAVVAFIAGFVFLMFAAGVGVSEFVDRAQHDYTAERLEAARWDCVESFVRSSTTGGELLRLVIEPADEAIRQRVVESVYPAVDLTTSEAAPALRVAVRPGDDPGATCPGLMLSIERS
jgi:hypothetical protein